MRLIDADAIQYIDLNSDMPQSKIQVWVAFKDKIDRMPTIEPERKRGKWIKVDNGYSYWYECSECGCEPLRSKWNGREVFSDFCPNCGADMRGGCD